MTRLFVALVSLCAVSAAEDVFFSKVGVVDEYPREVARGLSLTLTGATKGNYKWAQLLVIGADGTCHKIAAEEIEEHDFKFIYRFGRGVGRYRFEFMATATKTIRSFARFDVWYGKRKPKDYKAPPLPDGPIVSRDVHPRVIERRVARQLNAMRKKLRQRPLKWNEAVANRARQHAERMAQANKKLHRIGRSQGVREMLGNGGSGETLSGSTVPWLRVTNDRPFGPPQLQSPSPKVRNHVMVFLHDDSCIERIMERAYGREPAFRICAVDPHALEIAVGAAWVPGRRVTTKKKGKRRPTVRRRAPTKFYIVVSFIQVNDRTIVQRQDRAFSALKREAKKLDPQHIRRLARWNRHKAMRTVLKRAALRSEPELVAAHLDAMLLLDEEAARRTVEDRVATTEKKLGWKKYTEAIALWDFARFVHYDAAIRRHARTVKRQAESDARKEWLKAPKDPIERAKVLTDLAGRTEGMLVHKRLKAELKKLAGG